MPREIDWQSLIAELQNLQPNIKRITQLIGHAQVLNLSTDIEDPAWISLAGLRALVSVLKDNTTVTDLDLSFLKIIDEEETGAYNSALLAELLAYNETIKVLRLNGFNLIDFRMDRPDGDLTCFSEEIRAIREKYLTSRKRDRNKIWKDIVVIYEIDQNFIQMVMGKEAFESILSIRERCGLAAFFQAVANSNVVSLELSHRGLRHTDLENTLRYYLSKGSKLRSLHVEHNNLNYCKVQKILNQTSIKALYLGNNHFTSQPQRLFENIVGCQLRLSVEANPLLVNSSVIEVLKRDQSIAELSINYDCMIPKSWAAILSVNKGLTFIGFQGGILSYEEFLNSEGYRIILGALQKNTTLQHLRYNGKPVPFKLQCLISDAPVGTQLRCPANQSASVVQAVMKLGSPVFGAIPSSDPSVDGADEVPRMQFE